METTPNTYWSLFAGYTAIWTLIVMFVIGLVREQRHLARRLKELEQRLRDDSPGRG